MRASGAFLHSKRRDPPDAVNCSGATIHWPRGDQTPNEAGSTSMHDESVSELDPSLLDAWPTHPLGRRSPGHTNCLSKRCLEACLRRPSPWRDAAIGATLDVVMPIALRFRLGCGDNETLRCCCSCCESVARCKRNKSKSSHTAPRCASRITFGLMVASWRLATTRRNCGSSQQGYGVVAPPVGDEIIDGSRRPLFVGRQMPSLELALQQIMY